MKFIILICNYDRKGKYFLFLFLFALKYDILILDKKYYDKDDEV